jgi:cell division protein FtsQ
MTTTQSRPTVVRSQVEPRLAERRRRVLEAHRRRRRRRWIAVALVVALVGAAVGAVLSPLLDVDRVVVDGLERVDPAEVQDASGVRRGDRLVAVDLGAARASVRDLPGVAAATVVREWPDTVRITVVEERPLVRVRAGDTEVVVSETGSVLPEQLVGDDGAQLPLLELTDAPSGEPDALAETVAPTLALYSSLPEQLAGVLSSARLGADGELGFELADGAVVHFGPVQDVPAKLVRVQATLEQVALECLERLDVSTERISVSRVAGCTPPAPTAVDGTAAAGATDGSTASATDGDDGAATQGAAGR